MTRQDEVNAVSGKGREERRGDARSSRELPFEGTYRSVANQYDGRERGGTLQPLLERPRLIQSPAGLLENAGISECRRSPPPVGFLQRKRGEQEGDQPPAPA